MKVNPGLRPTHKVNVPAVLRTIQRLQEIGDDEFNMASWCNCIAGHTLRAHGEDFDGIDPMAVFDIQPRAADILGITEEQSQRLFCSIDINRHRAISILRDLAATGTV